MAEGGVGETYNLPPGWKRFVSGGSGSGTPETPKGEEEERKLSWREIQNELRDSNISEDDKEKLLLERGRIINEIMDFDSVFVNAYRWSLIEEARGTDWDHVYGKLIGVGIRFEKELLSKEGSDKKRWAGVLSDAADAWASDAVVAGVSGRTEKMSGDEYSQWLNKKHYSGSELKAMRERMEMNKDVYLTFGLPQHPEELVGDDIEEKQLPSEEIIEEQQRKIDYLTQQVLSNRITPESLREAMSQMSPDMLRGLYLKAERAMIPLPDAEVQLPTFLLKDATEEEIEEWQARIMLVNACAHIRAAPGYKELFPNQAAIRMTNVQLEWLLNKNGVLEAKSLLSVILKEGSKIGTLGEILINGDDTSQIYQTLLDSGFSEVEVEKISQFISSGYLVNNVYDIQESRQFEALLNGVTYWLIKNRQLDRQDAEDCAAIAWNLTYLAGEPFYYDSVFFQNDRPGGKDVSGNKLPGRASPTLPQFKSLASWMLMHPRERLDSKITASNNAWGMFGSWALNRYIKSGKISAPIKEPVLPKRLIPDVFSYTKDGSEITFSSIFLNNGDLLVKNPVIPVGRLGRPNFSGMKEGLFATYQYLQVGPAIKLFSIFDNPNEFKGPWNVLSDAYRDLKILNKYREVILRGIYGIDPNKRDLTPRGGVMEFGLGYKAYKEEVLRHDPNYFASRAEEADFDPDYFES